MSAATYALRYSPDAGGHVKRYAGNTITTSENRDWLDQLRRECPNGAHMDVIEVGGGESR